MHTAIQRCECIKKYFLGNEYLDGIWIGYYVGASGNKRYIIEYYEQDFDRIQIRGHSYTEELDFHSSWASTSVTIDEQRGKVFYTYSVNGLDENINNIGCAEFDFERENSRMYPLIIRGFSTDIQIGKRVNNHLQSRWLELAPKRGLPLVRDLLRAARLLPDILRIA